MFTGKKASLSVASPVLVASLACGDSPDVVDFTEEEQTSDVLEETLELAEQGDAGAQANLGLMYSEGRGVPEDDAEAVRWYRDWATGSSFAYSANCGLNLTKSVEMFA